eukprot:scaffold240857_cov30-Tisochrysis_lutea.AAC.2
MGVQRPPRALLPVLHLVRQRAGITCGGAARTNKHKLGTCLTTIPQGPMPFGLRTLHEEWPFGRHPRKRQQPLHPFRPNHFYRLRPLPRRPYRTKGDASPPLPPAPRRRGGGSFGAPRCEYAEAASSPDTSGFASTCACCPAGLRAIEADRTLIEGGEAAADAKNFASGGHARASTRSDVLGGISCGCAFISERSERTRALRLRW